MFKGSKGNWTLEKSFIVGTGANGTNTPVGVYTVTYTCEKDGAAGKTVLLVVVEEEKAA